MDSDRKVIHFSHSMRGSSVDPLKTNDGNTHKFSDDPLRHGIIPTQEERSDPPTTVMGINSYRRDRGLGSHNADGTVYWSNPADRSDFSNADNPQEDFARMQHGSSDMVNHPDHYNQYHGFEVIDVCEQLRAPDGSGNYNRGNAFKYLARAGWKNPDKHLEDLRKAMFYLQREIDRVEGEKYCPPCQTKLKHDKDGYYCDNERFHMRKRYDPEV
jgi:hypothetical protein